ncbi:MAG: hypothetical protein ACT4P7_11615 [Gemmatimonadaceae bacterium]
MTTDTMHRPTPEFRHYLEDEIMSAFRRDRSLARLRTFAVVAACLAAGATAGLASAQIRERAQRDSLLEVALSDLSLAALRLDLARARHVDVSAKVNAGVVGSATLASAESELRGMEAAAARAKLNVDEIRATSLPPRDEVNAPVVGTHDFVMERLQLDLFAGQQRLTAAEQALAEIERQARVGAVRPLVALDAGLEVTRARAALGTLAERRKLRKEFIDQGTPGDELMRRLQQASLRLEAYVLQEAVKVSSQRLDAVRKQNAAGLAASLDVLRAEVELREREVELQLLARQLRNIGSKGGDQR